MPQRKRGQHAHGRSEGVQIRLDPALKQQARVYLTMAHMTWQDLLEPCIRHFVDATQRNACADRPAPPRARVAAARE
jgi:hypothetical protein